jgi:hypothetical protein
MMKDSGDGRSGPACVRGQRGIDVVVQLRHVDLADTDGGEQFGGAYGRLGDGAGAFSTVSSPGLRSDSVLTDVPGIPIRTRGASIFR